MLQVSINPPTWNTPTTSLKVYIYILVNYFIRNYFYWKFSLIYTFAYLCKLRVQFVYPHFCLNNIILSDRLDILQTMLFFHKYQSLDGSDIGAKSTKVTMRVRESEVWLAKMAFTWNIYLSCLLNDKNFIKSIYFVSLFQRIQHMTSCFNLFCVWLTLWSLRNKK